MKVKELIEELSKLDPELDVIIGKDREGNDHSPCDGVQLGEYTPTCTWSGEWIDEGVPRRDKHLDWAINAVVLYPVN